MVVKASVSTFAFLCALRRYVQKLLFFFTVKKTKFLQDALTVSLQREDLVAVVTLLNDFGSYFDNFSPDNWSALCSGMTSRSFRRQVLSLLPEQVYAFPDLGMKLYEVFLEDSARYDSIVADLPKLKVATRLVDHLLLLNDFQRIQSLVAIGVSIQPKDASKLLRNQRIYIDFLSLYDALQLPREYAKFVFKDASLSRAILSGWAVSVQEIEILLSSHDLPE